MANLFSRRAALTGAAVVAATPFARASMSWDYSPSLPPSNNMSITVPTSAADTAATVPMGPLPSDGAQYDVVTGQSFPRLAWAPELYAQTILAEFGASGWVAAHTPDTPDDSPDALKGEIAVLNRWAAQRPARSAEIMAQLDNPLGYWADMLMMQQASGPRTWALIHSAVAVGQMVAMHWKLVFHRARPVQVFPALMPPAPTPRHPSYPNAHALQAALITSALAEVVPATMVPALRALAVRIGQNREIAGFHFPSDTAASWKLAPKMYDKLAAGRSFQALVADAKGEWGG